MLKSLFGRLRQSLAGKEIGAEAVGEPAVQAKDRFRYTSVTDPRFSRADGSMIDCYVLFPEIDPAPLHYTSAQSDPGWEHSEEIYQRCLAGEFGPVAPFVPREQ